MSKYKQPNTRIRVVEDKWGKIKKENAAFHELMVELKIEHPEGWEEARQYMRDYIERIFSGATVTPVYWDEETRKFMEGKAQPLEEDHGKGL